MLFGVTFVFSMLKLLDSFDWEKPKSATSQLAIVAGALSFLIFLALLHELNGVWGMSLVGLTSIIGLLLLRRKVNYLPLTGRASTFTLC